MAEIINFPHYLEDEIRINNATEWIPFEDYNTMFTGGVSYPLLFNENTEEWYVIDNQNCQNYSFCLVCKGLLK